MILEQMLRKGFALAHRRLGLILVDLVWKATWLAITAAALLLVFGWFGAQLQSIEWRNTWLLTTVLRQFWDEHGAEFWGGILLALCFSAMAWFVLEAFFRRRMVHALTGDGGRRPNSELQEFGLRPPSPVCPRISALLAFRALKLIVLAGAGTTLFFIAFGEYLTTPLSEWPAMWTETRGTAIAGFVTFAGLAFLLTIFETLLRTDALDLLGTDLIRAAGLIGILLLFEWMIGASLLIGVVAGFLHVAGATGAMTMFVILVFVMLLRSVFHSYLLVVRFSTVGIMRRNIVNV